jgi:hypothetical protein
VKLYVYANRHKRRYEFDLNGMMVGPFRSQRSLNDSISAVCKFNRGRIHSVVYREVA